MAHGRLLTVDLLPDRLRNAPDISPTELSGCVCQGMTLREVERACLTQTLGATGGNKRVTAQRLGISRRALYDKLQRHSLR